MKPAIAIFGLPKSSAGKIKVFVHSGGSGTYLGDEVFNSSNDESGEIIGYSNKDIEVRSRITITVMSSGIEENNYSFNFIGGDISYVPKLTKETSINDKHVAKDWNIDLWRAWNPNESHSAGVDAEAHAVISRRITKLPVQDSYYYDSQIDYTEKFHKLWIGLNAYCSERSSESKDKMKVLWLVESPLPAFQREVQRLRQSAI